MPRKKTSPVWTVIGGVFLLAALIKAGLVGWLILAVFAAIMITYILVSATSREKKLRALTISNVDYMGGHEFEHYVGNLLVARGFQIRTTRRSGDLGVDLTAESNGGKISVQVKRQNKPVSRRAVSDAVAGMAHFGCNKAMVITNNYFTPGAKQLARSTGCELVDRDLLTQWIMAYQRIT